MEKEKRQADDTFENRVMIWVGWWGWGYTAATATTTATSSLRAFFPHLVHNMCIHYAVHAPTFECRVCGRKRKDAYYMLQCSDNSTHKQYKYFGNKTDNYFRNIVPRKCVLGDLHMLKMLNAYSRRAQNATSNGHC